MLNLSAVSAILFTPGNRPERFDKARELGAKGVVIDLEDAIALSEKDAARQLVIEYFQHCHPAKDFLRCLRINSIKTPAGLKDITAIIESKIKPDVIVIPKTEYAAEIVILDNLLKSNNFPYIALIETAVGLGNAEDIAAASKNVAALCFGGGDLAADLGAELTWEPMLYARSLIVKAAAQQSLAVFDVPYLNLRDTDETRIREETKQVKALGYTGKFAIHPKQIKPITEVFYPAPEEIARATRIVEAYTKAQGNVCEIDGKMVDMPVIRSAQRILALAK